MDGMYAQMVREWTRTKQESMVKAGYHLGGVPPFGYISEPVPGMNDVVMTSGKVKPAPRRLVLHPENAAHALRAFTLVDETGIVADAQRHLYHVDPERQWSITQVKAMLTNRRYLGEARSGEIINPTAHPAIVSPELWERVQQRLAGRAAILETIGREIDEPQQYRKAQRIDPIAYYLRGRVFCSHCGALMTPAGHHGAQTKVGYYECRKAPQKGQKCPIARVNAKALHDVISEEITRLADHPTRFDRLWRDVIREMPKTHDLSEELARAKRNRRETEKKQARLIEAIKAGIPPTAVATEIKNLQALAMTQDKEIEGLTQQLAMGQPKRPDMEAVFSLWTEWRDNAAYLSEDEKAELLELLVGPVTLTGRTAEGITAEIDLLLSDDRTVPAVFTEEVGDSHLAQKLQTPFSNVEKGAYLGAGARLELATFGL